jgi:hypothetical protein
MSPAADPLTHRRLAQATWIFVDLGVLLRVARYLMDYPLWWDEAFLAVNFIRRDYRDMLLPLDYNQVCPVLFLWIELAVVRLVGFSAWSLRLFPLVCAVLGVVVFRHAAGRVVRGLPLLLAVAIFAVSFHPIRHAADVKPYATDLLVGLVLLALVFEWRRTPDRSVWLWVLAAVGPLALALSHPAVFVAGGVVVGLLPAVAQARRRHVWLAYALFVANTALTFALLYAVFTRAQSSATLGAMQAQWTAAFPPLGDPLALLRWMASVHTGGMFAYPCGGERGASSLTTFLFVVGSAVLWRQGRRTVVLSCLAPFGVALAAAALRRYPYGGVAHGSPARVMQYLVPGICLLAGVGASAILARIADRRLRHAGLGAGLVALAGIGIVPLVLESSHPYRSVHAQRARQFARRFWPEFTAGAVPVCLLWDLGLRRWDSRNLNVAVYLCNQQIYSPPRRRGEAPQWRAVSAARPLRCVLPLAEPDEPAVAAWLDAVKTAHDLREHRRLLVNMAEPEAPPRIEPYHVFEFVPRSGRISGRRDGVEKGRDPVEQLAAADVEDVGMPRAGDLDERSGGREGDGEALGVGRGNEGITGAVDDQGRHHHPGSQVKRARAGQ